MVTGRVGASLRRIAPLSDAAVAALAAIARPRRFRKGAYLLRGGERAEHCFLIERGLVREHYVGEGGEEHTRTFLAEGELTGSLVDLLSGEPAITWIQALEDTDAIAWRYREFEPLCARMPELAALARRNAERLAVRKTRREHELLALSAAERYARWLEEHAALDGRVSRKLLASWLGVTPEHVSRLAAGRTRPRRGRARREKT